jgi:hypothetical protein
LPETVGGSNDSKRWNLFENGLNRTLFVLDTECKRIDGFQLSRASSTSDVQFRHSRAGGNPDYAALASSLNGIDKHLQF